jgi:hypothetical protein
MADLVAESWRSSVADGHEIKGQCLCGAVAYSAQVESLHVDACHCSMCRRWTGGPLHCLESKDGKLSITGEDHVTFYGSSEWGERGFCSVCGSTLFWRTKDRSYAAIAAGSLIDEAGLVFTKQIFVDEKPSYYSFANATEMLTGPEFLALMKGDKPQ